MKTVLLFFFSIILSSTSSFADEDAAAKVNGIAITPEEIESEINRLIPGSSYHRNISSERRNEFRQKALEQLINRELQYQDAAARGMKPDRSKIKAEMAGIRDRFKSKKEYLRALERSGLTEDQLRSRVEKAVLVSAAIEKIVIEPARMTEEALKAHYEKNIAEFKQPESLRMRLISSKDEKKAREALARVKAGEDFSGTALTMSEDSYRLNGGDTGYIGKGSILPELEKAASGLKAGDISDLIKANDTWYIIKVEDKKPGYQASFEESRDKLKKELEKKRAAELQEKWIAGLREKAKIEVLEAGPGPGNGMQ